MYTFEYCLSELGWYHYPFVNQDAVLSLMQSSKFFWIFCLNTGVSPSISVFVPFSIVATSSSVFFHGWLPVVFVGLSLLAVLYWVVAAPGYIVLGPRGSRSTHTLREILSIVRFSWLTFQWNFRALSAWLSWKLIFPIARPEFWNELPLIFHLATVFRLHCYHRCRWFLRRMTSS